MYLLKNLLKNKVKKLITFLFILAALPELFAYEFSVNVYPAAFFPVLSAENRFDSLGFGGFVDAGINFFDILNVGTEAGYIGLPKKNPSLLADGSDKIVSFIPYGLQVSAFYYPFSRVETQAGVAGGAYIGFNNSKPVYSVWYRAYADVDFRISPNFSLGINGGIFDIQGSSYFGNPLALGFNAGLSAKIKLDSVTSTGKIDVYVNQNESVFPLFYTVYKNNSFGTIFLENNETAEIQNVKVTFRAGEYTSSEITCGTVKKVKKHKTVELNFYADFSDEILRFTEPGQIPGEIVVEYELLGKKKTSVTQVIIPVYNRNQVRWTDYPVIASYISTTSQEVLEFSKYLVGIARSHLRTGLNRNMQFAMYLYEGIRLSGIQYKSDPSTPYDYYHLDTKMLDYIQYPYQTMFYKSGDKDDLGILYLALLESVGIEAAYIPLSDEFIVAVNLGIDAAKIGTLFDGYDRVIIIDDEVWIPLSMSTLKEGFVNSWYDAMYKIQVYADNDVDLDLVRLSDAWQSYPPSGFSSSEEINIAPNEKSLTASVENDISRYIAAEFGPQIAAVQNQIKTEGASVSLFNKLGMLYVRAGMYSSALPIYEQSAKMGSVSAMTNLGNIYSLQKNYTESQKWYEKALEIDPDNASAKKNLSRILSEIEK